MKGHISLPFSRGARRQNAARVGDWNENTETAPEWRWRVGQVGVGKYAYGEVARSGRRLAQLMMMSIQSIWFLVAMVLCVVVSLALALGLWLLISDPANQTYERPSD